MDDTSREEYLRDEALKALREHLNDPSPETAVQVYLKGYDYLDVYVANGGEI